jgi:hypothetical protein
MRPEVILAFSKFDTSERLTQTGLKRGSQRPTKVCGGESELTASERDAINSDSFRAKEIV